jgi:putative nucleotidyltransferase with HDIG domain
MVKYKGEGTSVDSETFDKLIQSRVLFLFLESDVSEKFIEWSEKIQAQEKKEIARSITSENKGLVEAIQGQRRAMLDIFTKLQLDSDDLKTASLESRKLVTELMRRPHAIEIVQAMQKHSKGIVDHSVNVAVLGAFICHRLGYNHQHTLETISMAGLLHDYGLVITQDNDRAPAKAEELDTHTNNLEHPSVGAEHIGKMADAPELLPLLIAQHHEFLDGTGYPRGLRGTSIHELSRILCIVNLYDELVSKSAAPTIDLRSREALVLLERDYEGKVDRKNLGSIIGILRNCLTKAAA